ncbi:MAG: YceI family protein [Caulobacteraceae bacterium]|nr:YceI family protein [Caulobacteraceae bacterium]
MTAEAPAPTPEQAGSGRYAAVAIVLHWLIAAALVFQILLGWRMGDEEGPLAFALVQLHKSVGITILVLSLARLGWRLANPPPPMPAAMTGWEKALARVTHVGFYLLMIGMPLGGWVIVSTSRTGIPTELWGVIPWPHIPGLSGLTGDARKGVHEAAEFVHSKSAWLLWGLLALHIAGALKHQWLRDDDPVLARMAPGAKPGRKLEPRLAIIVLGLLAAGAFAYLLSPPLPRTLPAPKADAVEVADVADAPPAPADASLATAPAANAAAPAEDQDVPAEPVRWVIDDGSKLQFETSWSGSKIEGEFARFTGDITFSPGALDRSRVRISIDLASVATGDGQRDASLKSEDFFNTGQAGTAVFTADRFTHRGGENYLANGALSLRGVSRPVSLPFRLQIDEDKARVRGVTTLDRTAFGVGQGEWAATDQIPAQVTVKVDLRARRG